MWSSTWSRSATWCRHGRGAGDADGAPVDGGQVRHGARRAGTPQPMPHDVPPGRSRRTRPVIGGAAVRWLDGPCAGHGQDHVRVAPGYPSGRVVVVVGAVVVAGSSRRRGRECVSYMRATTSTPEAAVSAATA